MAVYFIKPAAVSARVITALTSMLRRRGSCFGGSGRGSSVVNGHNTLERSGIGADDGASIGETVGISFALGDSAAAGLGCAAFGCAALGCAALD